MQRIDSHQSFGGQQLRYEHASSVLGCTTTLSVYIPPGEGPYPVLYWLSGLTCTDENFVIKAGAQQHAAKHGLVIVAPDTSPRGEGVPDAPDAAFDLGFGAGFYLNATQAPWAEHYKMYDYVVSELPELVASNFPVDPERQSIAGHSMGGHGALMIGLRNAHQFKSISAFAPISSVSQSGLAQKAMSAYLGDDQSAWQQYDVCALLADTSIDFSLPVLVDQGSEDEFLSELRPDLLNEASMAAGRDITQRMQEGYDHSYFFVSSFIGEHLAFHAEHLKR